MRTQIKPTRAELRETKRKLGMVRRGHKLLERKQESLMVELFRALDRYRAEEASAAQAAEAASRACTQAEMVAGRHAAWGYAMTRSGSLGVEFSVRQFMGVRLPELRALPAPGAAPFLPGEAPQNIEAVQACQELVSRCVALAEAEASLMALLDEIERTKRRVNALELKVIPSLEEDATFIMSRLEEMERESLFSLKRIRAKIRSA